MTRIWIDIKNSHEPAFFSSFLTRFTGYEFFITSKKYAEIQKLMDNYNLRGPIIGKHYGGSKIKKFGGLAFRDAQLLLKAPRFDISLSHGSINAIHTAKMRFKKAISFEDNEKSYLVNKICFRFVDYLITPKILPLKNLIEHGAKRDNIIQYDGFKEDIYEADFTPNSDFLKHLPFTDFIAIRPEALKAIYIKDKRSIVPNLIKAFNREGIEILYLPRYPTDRDYANDMDVFIPDGALNGLDICYHSRAVLTGSGTFAREAACMGTPAVSFYPEELLAVDQKMVDDGRIFHSRNAEEIVDYVLSTKKCKADLSRSKHVQSEVFNIFEDILDEIEGKRGTL